MDKKICELPLPEKLREEQMFLKNDENTGNKTKHEQIQFFACFGNATVGL